MFNHRSNGQKPSATFLEYFKSNAWHPGPQPTAETFKLGEDVYATTHVSAHDVCNTDDSFRECFLPLGDTSNAMVASFYDAATWDTGDEDPANSRPMSRNATESVSTASDALDWGSLLSTSITDLSRYSASSPSGFTSSSYRFQSPSFEVPGNSIGSPSFGLDVDKQSPSSVSQSKFMNESWRYDSIRASEKDQRSLPEANQPRFVVSLDAPTAMVYSFGSPLTYLNREQKYLISISDVTSSTIKSITCRVAIQVSFENNEQRQHPALCWEIWQSTHPKEKWAMEGKSSNGIEYVTSVNPADGHQNPTIDFQKADTTGFSFIWTRQPKDSPQCQVAVCFHFVSTDFNHAKGIKGIPLRLSALIEDTTPDLAQQPHNTVQISYCLIKVFRNNGAERKRANDGKQIRKKIEKIDRLVTSQKFALNAKASRDCLRSMAAAEEPSQTHRATCGNQRFVSKTLNFPSDGPEFPEDHALFQELAKLKLAVESSQSTTDFGLKGEEHDFLSRGMLTPETTSSEYHGSPEDPPGNDISDFSSMINWGKEYEDFVSKPIVSINFPLAPQCGVSSTNDYVCGLGSSISNPRAESPGSQSSIPTAQERIDEPPAKRIKLLDTDPLYRPPISAPAKAALCVCVRYFQRHRAVTSDDYYLDVYLRQPTTRDLIASIVKKFNFPVPSTRIWSAVYVSDSKNWTRVDDEFVRGINQGQDMSVELVEANTELEMDTESDGHGKAADENRHNWYLKLRY